MRVGILNFEFTAQGRQRRGDTRQLQRVEIAGDDPDGQVGFGLGRRLGQVLNQPSGVEADRQRARVGAVQKIGRTQRIGMQQRQHDLLLPRGQFGGQGQFHRRPFGHRELAQCHVARFDDQPLRVPDAGIGQAVHGEMGTVGLVVGR